MTHEPELNSSVLEDKSMSEIHNERTQLSGDYRSDKDDRLSSWYTLGECKMLRDLPDTLQGEHPNLQSLRGLRDFLGTQCQPSKLYLLFGNPVRRDSLKLLFSSRRTTVTKPAETRH